MALQVDPVAFPSLSALLEVAQARPHDSKLPRTHTHARTHARTHIQALENNQCIDSIERLDDTVQLGESASESQNDSELAVQALLEIARFRSHGDAAMQERMLNCLECVSEIAGSISRAKRAPIDALIKERLLPSVS